MSVLMQTLICNVGMLQPHRISVATISGVNFPLLFAILDCNLD